jgi:hypothetical protein
LEDKLEEGKAREMEYSKLNVEYVGRKRELDLKADLAFQEYSHPMEKEYMMKRVQLANKETAAKDLEVMCKAMEAAVSNFHREKMDEVNKYLAEIWQ